MDKKGFFAIADIVAMFLIIILVTGFMVLFGASSIEKSDKEVIGALDVMSSKRYTYNLLDASVGDEKKIIFSDLVVKSFEEDGSDYSKLKDFFNKEFSETSLYWYMGIYEQGDPNNPKGVMSRDGWGPAKTSTVVQEIVIPSYSKGNILLKIRMVAGRQSS